jgi:hypothetical protein
LKRRDLLERFRGLNVVLDDDVHELTPSSKSKDPVGEPFRLTALEFCEQGLDQLLVLVRFV